jgi:hypothetical protein
MKPWHAALTVTTVLAALPSVGAGSINSVGTGSINPIAPTSNPPTSASDSESWKEILRTEGGLTNHPNDIGGLTNLGVTASMARQYGIYDVRTLTPDQAIAIYKRAYPHCDQYQNQGVRHICRSTSVNFGAAKKVPPGTNSWFSLSEGLDPSNPKAFIDGVCDRRRAHRKNFIARNPSQSVFRQGWERRDNEDCTFAQDRA